MKFPDLQEVFDCRWIKTVLSRNNFEHRQNVSHSFKEQVLE